MSSSTAPTLPRPSRHGAPQGAAARKVEAFLDACEKEKVDLHAEMDSEEIQLKTDYDGMFADLEEEEIARAELESNEQKAKDENQVRYRQERELEVLAQKLNESARECKNCAPAGAGDL